MKLGSKPLINSSASDWSQLLLFFALIFPVFLPSSLASCVSVVEMFSVVLLLVQTVETVSLLPSTFGSVCQRGDFLQLLQKQESEGNDFPQEQQQRRRGKQSEQ